MGQHWLQEAKASELVAEVDGQVSIEVVAINYPSAEVVGQTPTEDTSYFVEAIDYFVQNTEVVAGRLGYIVATGWANYCSNSILEQKNLGEYCLATNDYYNQNYSEGLEAYLIFEKHKTLLLYLHQFI